MAIGDWFRRKRPDERPRTPPFALTGDQHDAIMQIVAIYETGKPLTLKPYDTVTIHADNAGITYGAHQFTRSLLLDVIRSYYDRGGVLKIGDDPITVEEAGHIIARSVRVTTKPTSGEVRALMTALEAAGRDIIMHEAQRFVAVGKIWQPTCETGQQLGLRYALSYLALYDLSVHSGAPSGPDDTGSRLWKLRQRFPEYPPSNPASKGERLWTMALLRARHAWLEAYYPATAYRTRSLLDLCERGIADQGVWHLATPLEVRIWRPKSGMESHTIGASPLDPPPAPRRVA